MERAITTRVCSSFGSRVQAIQVACAWLVMTLAGCAAGDSPNDSGPSGLPAFRKRPQLVVLDLSKPLVEAAPSEGWMPQGVEHTFAGRLGAIRRLTQKNATKGLFIRFGMSRHSWAHTQELGAALSELKNNDVPVYCHADALSNTTIWLALASCSKIWLSPAGNVDTVGIAGQAIYLRGLLDKLKVEPQFLHMGRYKSAAESVTEHGPSPDAQESLTSVLASIRDTWLKGVATAHPIKDIRQLLEDGPWTPLQAKERGLVHEVGYESEARQALTEASASERFTSLARALGEEEEADELSTILRLLTGTEDRSNEPHIAVLPAQGGIAMGKSQLSDSGIWLQSLRKEIRRLREDSAVKAVVLRIDSPGGSALASDLLWHELIQLREQKPLIASVGSMAASGGYYLACAADKILAPETSIVGSIGVVGGKFSVEQALQEYGIGVHTFSANPDPALAGRAAYSGILSPWDDATKEKVRQQMSGVYELFLKRVAAGRKTTVEEVRKVAEGRIWSGLQGSTNGLVDELGGLDLALEHARKAADLPEGVEVRIQGGTDSLLEMLGLTGDEEDGEEVAAGWLRMLGGMQPLPKATAPGLSLTQQAHLISLMPLLGTERVVTALPLLLNSW